VEGVVMKTPSVVSYHRSKK